MTVIQHRRGTTAEWAASSYILEAGELGIEIDTAATPDVVLGVKVGNGESLWSALSYVGNVSGDLTNVTSISTPNYIALDTTPTGVPTAVGVISWNAVDKTLDIQSEGITYQVGQELAQNVKRFDSTGLTDGKVVYITGSSGANIYVDYALATSDATSANTFGVMTASASGGSPAPCTTFGLVRNIDTSALTEGATVYLSNTVAGGMTTTKPVAPHHTVKIGICIRSHAVEGSVFVSVQNGYELDELHDVLINGKADKDLVAYESSTGLWKNKTFTALGLAKIDSQTFTGIPAAPTAAAGTNTTQIATTAFVGTAVANLVASAPTTLDTLNELAVALGNDANFSTTVTNAIALKAPITDAGLLGTPTAPTAAVDTNTTQLATTAYVIGQGYLKSATAASTYLTQSNAASTYLTQANASSTYLTQSNAATTYLTQATAASTYAPLSGAAFTGTTSVTDATGFTVKNSSTTGLRIFGSQTVSASLPGIVISPYIDGVEQTNSQLYYASNGDRWTFETDLSVSGKINANGGISGVTAKNMTVASSYSGSAFNGARVVMTASAASAAAPTTRPDATTLAAGDIWISW